jgi:hypothetical protein
VHRVERLQHLDVVEGLSQGVRGRSSLKDLRFVNKLRRSRPSNSLKDKCREAAMESLREASLVGERVNESRGEILLHFESSKDERMDEII